MDTRHQNLTNVHYKRFPFGPPGDPWYREENILGERGDKVRKEWETDTLNRVVKSCPAVGSLGSNSGSHTSSVILPRS